MTYDPKVNVKLFAFRAIDRFKVCMALTFDHKVISSFLKSSFKSTHYKQLLC